METIERWWNGLWGTSAKQEVFLHVEAGHWVVEHRRRGQSRFWLCDSQVQARAIVEGLLAAGPGDWREMPDPEQQAALRQQAG